RWWPCAKANIGAKYTVLRRHTQETPGAGVSDEAARHGRFRYLVIKCERLYSCFKELILDCVRTSAEELCDLSNSGATCGRTNRANIKARCRSERMKTRSTSLS